MTSQQTPICLQEKKGTNKRLVKETRDFCFRLAYVFMQINRHISFQKNITLYPMHHDTTPTERSINVHVWSQNVMWDKCMYFYTMMREHTRNSIREKNTKLPEISLAISRKALIECMFFSRNTDILLIDAFQKGCLLQNGAKNITWHRQ